MARQVRLLGAVQLEVDDETRDLRGPRQQRLLAMLSLHRGSVVSSERLIDAVWPNNDLPPDPRATLRTYVSRLRQTLGDAGLIESRDGGYSLSALVTVDATQFECSLDDAEQIKVPSHRADVLAGAIGLWTGPALDGFAHEGWAAADAARLDELKAIAVDRRARSLIEAGDLDTAISTLEGSVREYPHRESLVVALMSALATRDRQADALRAYQDYRRRLATDVGLEPGPDIVALERQIVAGEFRTDDAVPLRGYRLEERIGEGAFAIVYRASQPSVGRTVAIKQIRSELANRPEFIRRFEAEAHLVARLEHPRIVPLYDYWREPGSAFLVMRWLRGGTLANALHDGPWPLDRAIMMINDVGGAVDAAHRAGVIHRDIKPENVLLDDDGGAYLTDFGIALEDSEGADPEAALSIGSPAYASPEQLRRERVGPTGDVWGLGITFYEAVTGRLPFAEATTQAELLDAQLHRAVPPIRFFRPDVPQAVDTVIATALAKEASARYASVRSFLEALDVAVAGPAVPESRARGRATALPSAVNPYKGLRAFDEADAGDFHGRARLVREIVVRLSAEGPSSRFVMLVGPSGSGKSSVVRAGLVPALRAGAVGRSNRWFYTSMTPGSHPFEALEAALLRVAVNPPPSLLDQLQSDRRGLVRASMRVVPDDQADVALVIDQFEELFTLCGDPRVRARFLDALATAIGDPASRVRIIATLRADFYDRPLERAGFAGLVRDNTVVVAPLAPDELEHAIVDPAVSVGTEFEPGLVAAIVAEVGDQPGALPLLQFALTTLYDERVSGLITLDAYRRMGGLTGAIAERAEQLYRDGTDEFRQACHHVFTRLVTLGQGAADTRRRVRRSEFGTADEVDAVIEEFGAARLLSFDRDPATREPTVELAHEALIGDWPRLRSWLDADREGLQTLRHLTAAAEGWDLRDRDPAELYRGGRLDTAAEWAAEHDDELNERERDFVAASRRLHEAEQELERRRVRRLRSLLMAVAMVAVFALVAGSAALWQWNRADDQTARAEASAQEAAGNAAEADENAARADANAADAEASAALAEQRAAEADVRRLSAEAVDQLAADEEIALLMALEAYRRSPSNDTLGAVQRVLVGLPRGWLGTMRGRMSYVRIAGSDDGTTIAAGGVLGVDMFDAETRQLVATFDADEVAAVDVSPDGSLIGVGTSTGEWWVLSSVGLEVLYSGTTEPISDLVFDWNGARVALGYADGTVAVLDAAVGNAPRPIGTIGSRVNDLAWKPDGSQIIAGGGVGHVARVFDVERAAQVGGDLIAAGTVTAGSTAVLFLGDDAVVANGPVIRFDIETGEEVRRFDGGDVDVRVNGHLHPYGPDSLVSIGITGRAHLLDFSEGTTTPLTPLGRAVGSAPVSDDLRVVAPSENSLIITSLTGERVIGTPLPLTVGSRKAAAISDDGSIVVSGFGTDVVWSRPGTPPVELGRAEATFPRIRGNNLWLGTTQPGSSGTYVMWTRDGGFEAVTSISETVSTIGLSPDGGLLVLPIGEERTSLRVVDRHTGVLVAELDEFESALPDTWIFPQDWVSDMEFSPDGTRMVAGTFGGAWGIWDTSSWTLVAPIVVDETNEIMDLDFADDGETVVSVSLYGDLAIRDAGDLSVIAGPVAAHSIVRNGGRAVEYTADGRFIKTDGDDGAKLWDAATLEPIGSVFPHDAPLQAAELARDAKLLATIVDDEVVVWSVDVDAWFEIGCRAVNRNMTDAEWEQFGPVGAYEPTCDSVIG